MNEEQFNRWLTEYFFDRLENSEELIRNSIEKCNNINPIVNRAYRHLSYRILNITLEPYFISELKINQTGLMIEYINEKINEIFEYLLGISNTEQSKFNIYSLTLTPVMYNPNTFLPYRKIMMRGFSLPHKRIGPYLPKPKKFNIHDRRIF